MDNVKATRQAIMNVSWALLADLLPDQQILYKLRHIDEEEQNQSEYIAELAQSFHDALKLPSNCKIVDISHRIRFNRDQVIIRIESPEFIETPPGELLPEVEAIHEFRFLRWEGPALVDSADACRTPCFMRWEGPAFKKKELIFNGLLDRVPCRFSGNWHIERITGLGEVGIAFFTGLIVDVFPGGPNVCSYRDDAILQVGDKRMRVRILEGGIIKNDGAPFDGATVEEMMAAMSQAAAPLAIPSLPTLPTSKVAPVLEACWSCKQSTDRRLASGEAECEACAGRPLL